MSRLDRDIKKCFPRLEGYLSSKTLWELSLAPSDSLDDYNLGVGTIIRLRLLGPKSPLYKSFIREGYTGRDEMAMEVIRRFHQHLRARPVLPGKEPEIPDL